MLTETWTTHLGKFFLAYLHFFCANAYLRASGMHICGKQEGGDLRCEVGHAYLHLDSLSCRSVDLLLNAYLQLSP